MPSRPKILEEIFERKREETRRLHEGTRLITYQGYAADNPSTRDFKEAITTQSQYYNIIAETKRASPKKALRLDTTANHLAGIYERCEVAAISVLTDVDFHGSLSDLNAISKSTGITPILRKDFIFDPYQVVEARFFGADAYLLMASMLARTQIRDLIRWGKDYNMDAVVEVHTEKELEMALKAEAEIIGINNRDFNDPNLGTDLETTTRLAPKVPKGMPLITASGIETYEDMQQVMIEGVSAALVGSGITKNSTDDSIRETIYKLQGKQCPS